jgi:hypothetical protein
MSAGDFFNRWSRNRTDTAVEAAAPSAPPVDAVPAAELPPPTLEDVAALGHDADFRRFVQPGVDETVRRSAMKKLFTDPHFNVMDGLDIYIGDYNTYEPMSAAMVAMLVHGKQLLDPLGHLQQPAMRMLDRLAEDVPTPADEAALATADAPSDVAVVGAEDAAVTETDTDTETETETPEPAAPEPAAIDTPKDPAPPQDDHTI